MLFLSRLSRVIPYGPLFSSLVASPGWLFFTLGSLSSRSCITVLPATVRKNNKVRYETLLLLASKQSMYICTHKWYRIFFPLSARDLHKFGMRSDVALEHCNGRYLDKSAVENLSHTRKNRVHTSIRSCWFVPEASQTDQKSGPLSLVVVAV